jgi:hypothetical protein
MKSSMIRTSAMFCGRQSQSIVMLLPFSGALLICPAPSIAISPTRYAWRFLSGKYPPVKDALAYRFRHIIPKAFYITVWGICRSFGKTFLKS